MDLEIHLLGTPRVLCGGVTPPPPRGNKGWALLACLLLNDAPVSRQRLVSLLFPDADDPLAAVRWNLHGLRQLIGLDDGLRGDPIELRLPPGTFVDVTVLRAGSWVDALEVPGLGHELLEGLSFGSAPAFEAWLTAQRSHLANATEWVLREGTLARLGSGEAAAAVTLASRLASMNPLDEGVQELYVRTLAASGDETAARRQLDRAVDLIRREVGVEPGPDLLEVCTRHVSSAPDPAREPAAVDASIEVALAAVLAGSYQSGLQTLRRAIADARTTGEPGSLLRALLAFGEALTYMSHGGGEEATATVYEAIELADELGDTHSAVVAYEQFALSELWRGHYERASYWVSRAADLVDEDDAEVARIDALDGTVLVDTGHYAAGIATLERSIARTSDPEDVYCLAYALSMLGRARILLGEIDAAVAPLDRSLELARRHWLAFAPWPEALRGEVALAQGDLGQATELFEHGYALACQLYRSTCWESINARGLGLTAAARGDLTAAIRWLDTARTRGTRMPGSYQWVRTYALDALCGIAVEHGYPGAPAFIATLEDWAGSRGMRELLARAYLHRARLGQPDAPDTARALALEIDNPSLLAAVAGVPA